MPCLNEFHGLAGKYCKSGDEKRGRGKLRLPLSTVCRLLDSGQM